MDTTIIENKFKSLFGNEYRVYTSPGRINLIGEHTDYNGGFVFPGAIDKGIYAAIQPNGTDKVRAFQSITMLISSFASKRKTVLMKLGHDIFSVYAERYKKRF